MKMVRFVGIFFFLFGALVFPAPEFPRSQGHVNDFAHMFSSHTTEILESRLVDFEKTTTNQIAVVTVETLNGRDIEGYANQLFREWGIGQKDKNNGVLILFAKNDRKSRIEVGRGLEGVLPDAICKTILDRNVRPDFRNGRFDQGVTNAVTAVTAAIGGKYAVSPLPSENNDGLPLGLSLGAWIVIIIIILVVLLIIFAYINDNSSGGSSSYYSSCGSDGGGSGGSSWGGGDSGGGGASSDW